MPANDRFDTANTDDFPLRYQEERLTDGVRFTLPRRRLGTARWIGAGIIAAGLFGFAFLSAWIIVPMIAGWQLVQQGEWFGWAICAFGALAVAGMGKCGKIFLFGLAVLTQRTAFEMELRNERMKLHERFFGLRWTRKIKHPIGEFRQLRVGRARLESSQADETSLEDWLGTFGSAIFAGGAAPKPIVIAPCYPLCLLAQLADDLLNHFPNVSAVDFSEPLLTEANDSSPKVFYRRVVQPEESNISVEQRPDGKTFRVPPAGMVKGSKGLFTFAIFWNVIVIGFAGLFGLAALNDPKASFLVFGLLIIPFIAVGIGVTLSAVNMARRKTAIVTAGREVFVISEGLFGKKTRTWHADDLTRVCMGPSGMSVNNVPVMELQFHSQGGKFGVLSERCNEELLWLSVQISFELGLMTVVVEPDVESDVPGPEVDAPIPVEQLH